MTERTRIVHDGIAALPGILRELGVRRPLVIVGEGRRHADRVSALLAELDPAVFAGARRHVPEATVAEASGAFEAHRADAVVSVGGGSTTGLGKALRLKHDFRFVAIPSTYSGSELTNIYGITTGGAKQTGRDDRVRPDVVIYDLELTRSMPKKLSVTSLMNALAHPFGALGGGNAGESAGADPDAKIRERALDAIERVFTAIESLVQAPESVRARELAVHGAALAAGVLSDAKLGLHHQLAHRLGGRFDLDHSSLHSVLLPHSVARLRRDAPEALAAIDARLGVPDLEGALFDFLTRAGAATSLKALEVDAAAFAEFLGKNGDTGAATLLTAAFLGRRPSRAVRLEDWGLREPVAMAGPELARARRVVVAIHGRGATAESIVRRALEIAGSDPELAVVAPQAPNGAWYAARYSQPRAAIGAELEQSLAEGSAVLQRVLDVRGGRDVVLLGFSQGACLALDLFARFSERLAGLVALSGGCIGPRAEWPKFPGEARAGSERAQVLLGASEGDPWMARADVEGAAQALTEAGHDVRLELVPGEAHGFHGRHRVLAREILTGVAAPPTLGGFHNAHESESLPGALPKDRNSPRRAPYGLYPEQINGTGFVARRGENLRSWAYRIRPAAQHGVLEPLVHATFKADFATEPPEPNLTGFAPLAIPSEPRDFVDGLCTIGGAGAAGLRRGFALHVYAANRNMEDRAFYDADGDLLILPELGAITLLTELGVLEVAPGTLAVVPRGVRFSVLLRESAARGYVAETFGRHFELPERGPIGANGVSESRHFRAPSAWHEDRLAPGYRLTAKFGGALFQTTQDHSPFDVVAWHGNYTPYSYDMALFSPVSNSRFDHADPSIYTVLSAPMDELGTHTLDFVIFPPRWDVSEGTFRPPYFHRNSTSEFNGIIKERLHAGSPFTQGGYFLTPCLTPHGVLAPGVERALALSDASADRPSRHSDDALWFQFETALPVSLTPWARSAPNRIAHWPEIWGAYRTHFSTLG